MAHLRWHFSTLMMIPMAWGCSTDPDRPGTVEPRVDARAELRVPLADETTVSSLLGFSLEQVLPVGVHAAELTWNEGDWGISFTPTATTASLAWSLELPERGSEAFRIDEVDVECDPERFHTNDESLCADQLEAALLLHLDSDDGALAETLPVTFIAQSPNAVEWHNLDLDLDTLAGTFSITASAGDPTTLRVGLVASITDGNLSGSLIGEVVLEHTVISDGNGEITNSGLVLVAQWLDAPPAAAP
jgi:hypothetical protein